MTKLLVNGINLNVEVSGEGPALLLIHGFTGNVAAWEPFLDDWPGYKIVRVDVIGHGESDAPPEPSRYTMDLAAIDLLAVLDQLGIETAALLGYSMGGRLALHVALAAPRRFWALLLESASTGLETAAEREGRIRSDEALAAGIDRDGLEKFVDYWQSTPLFESQRNLPAATLARQRERRLKSAAPGLANSLRGMGTGTQAYLMPRLKELTMPVLLIAGTIDTKYTELALQMAAHLGYSESEIVPMAGHTVHLEQPKIYSRIVLEFLERFRPHD